MIYKIEIIETLSRIMEVEAESVEEAIEQIEDRYYTEEIVLDSDDHCCTQFKEYEE